jgi:non-specific serine/threonine protein kinase
MVWLGVAQISRGDFTGGVLLIEEGLRQFRTLQDQPGTAFALLNLGVVAAIQGEAGQAAPLFEESLALFRALGDTRYVAIAQTLLGSSLTDLGDATRAAGLVADGLRSHWTAGDRTYLAYTFVVLAGVLNRLDQPVRAVRLLGAAEALRETLGGLRAFATLSRHDRLVASLRRRVGEADFEPAWAAGRGTTLNEIVVESLTATQIAATPTRSNRADQRRDQPEPLTRREREVARLVAQGYTDRQIAEALTIAPSTVGTHVHHVLAKLGVHSRWQVTDRLLDAGSLATHLG